MLSWPPSSKTKTQTQTQTMTTLTSDQLREQVSRAVPGNLEFTECSKPDGCMHARVEGKYDEFDIAVNLAEFISAQYGVPADSVRLTWDAYYWAYTAEF